MLKSITLKADETLIQQAQAKAARQNKTINAVFRECLSRYISTEAFEDNYKRLMKRLGHTKSGQKLPQK
jgi:hypothetical protein